jgi:hypothetical protein
MTLIETINIALFALFFILLFLENILQKKFYKYGITVKKNKYLLKTNVFKDNVGKEIIKDDVVINVINENLCLFDASRIILPPSLGVIIHGYLKIDNNNVIVVYKQPLAFMILVLLIIINILVTKEYFAILIGVAIFGGILLILTVIKILTAKQDIEYFINNGK